MIGFRLFLNHFERITNPKGELTSELCFTDHNLYAFSVWHITAYKIVTKLIPFYRAIFHTMGRGSAWLCLIIAPVASIIPRFIFKVFGQRFFPGDIQIAREAEKLGTLSDWEHSEIQMNQTHVDRRR